MARIGLENIIMSFGTNSKRSTVLEDINLHVNDGDFVSLIGPSGCGKSTLLDLVAGLKKPTFGRILIDGQEILGPGPDRGVVFQDYSLFPWMSALENICFAIEHSREKLSKSETLARANQYLEIVGLSKFIHKHPGTLSGGMRQRLAIAQALVSAPKLLIIDEPTTGLDPGERVAFRNMIFDLGRSCVILLSTHIVKDVEFSCHGMALLFGGRQHFCGEPLRFMDTVRGRVFEVELPFSQFDGFAAAHHVVAIHEHGDRVNVRFITPEPSSDVPGALLQRVNLEDAYVDFIRARQREEEQAFGQAV